MGSHRRPGEGYKKAISLRAHFLAMIAREDLPQQVVVLGKQSRIALPQPLQQPGRALDIGEQKSDRPARQVSLGVSARSEIPGSGHPGSFAF